jgi:hypothetical protein
MPSSWEPGSSILIVLISRLLFLDLQIRSAELEVIREDLWAVLSLAPLEVPAIRAALVEGRVDGGTYYGECACLLGTIANARGCDSCSLESLRPAPDRPIEHFFRPRNAFLGVSLHRNT